MESHVSVPADPPVFVTTRNRISIYWIYNPKIDHIFPFYCPKLFTIHFASRNFHLLWFLRPGFLFTIHFASEISIYSGFRVPDFDLQSTSCLLCCFASWISIYSPLCRNYDVLNPFRVPKFHLQSIIRVPNFYLL